jgi:hypothetical protein
MGMLHLVKVAMFATVMDMAVKQKESVTCRLGCVSAKIIQRVTHATGARRAIMEIPGGSAVGKISYVADISVKLHVDSIIVFRCSSHSSVSEEYLKSPSLSGIVSLCLLVFFSTSRSRHHSSYCCYCYCNSYCYCCYSYSYCNCCY